MVETTLTEFIEGLITFGDNRNLNLSKLIGPLLEEEGKKWKKKTAFTPFIFITSLILAEKWRPTFITKRSL